jgi:hypothetical protein
MPRRAWANRGPVRKLISPPNIDDLALPSIWAVILPLREILEMISSPGVPRCGTLGNEGDFA